MVAAGGGQRLPRAGDGGARESVCRGPSEGGAKMLPAAPPSPQPYLRSDSSDSAARMLAEGPAPPPRPPQKRCSPVWLAVAAMGLLALQIASATGLFVYFTMSIAKVNPTVRAMRGAGAGRAGLPSPPATPAGPRLDGEASPPRPAGPAARAQFERGQRGGLSPGSCSGGRARLEEARASTCPDTTAAPLTTWAEWRKPCDPQPDCSGVCPGVQEA